MIVREPYFMRGARQDPRAGAVPADMKGNADFTGSALADMHDQPFFSERGIGRLGSFDEASLEGLSAERLQRAPEITLRADRRAGTRAAGQKKNPDEKQAAQAPAFRS